MRELIAIQWGRLGDLLQTRVLLDRWGRRSANPRVTVMIDRRLNAIARLFPEVDRIIPVDLMGLTSRARHRGTQADLIGDVRDLLQQTANLRGDEVVVLSRSRAAATVAQTARAGRRHGYQWIDGALRVPDLLKDYLRHAHGGTPVPMNICDVWTLLAGCEVEHRVPTTISTRKTSDRGEERLALIADAGVPERHPPTDWLARLAHALHESGGRRVVIVGRERPAHGDSLSVLATRHAREMEDLRGQTSLKNLAGEFERCGTVIGPDTGGLHLAAAVGCRTIGLFHGGALAAQTGPYSLKSAVLQTPEWSDCEIQAVCEEHEGRKAGSGRPLRPNWWRPSWDEFGLSYLPENCREDTRVRIQRARREFLDRVGAEDTKQLA